MRTFFRIAALALLALATPMPAYAISWEISCEVDRGSITRQAGSYVFRTSTNHCPGGIFNQRAELASGNISISRQVTYVFDTTLAMTSASSEDFIVFQIHDGRNGCSPPLSVRWRGNGRLSFDSDYTRGQGMAGCVENRALRNAAYGGPRLQRDGTPYHFQVQVAFDGAGAFDVYVLIDGAPVISGTYQPSSQDGFVASNRFYMKHGVYSQNIFGYEMISSGMQVFEVR